MSNVIKITDLFPEPPNKGVVRGPLPKQKQFMDMVLAKDGPVFVGYYGGYGSGKSMILCIVMLMQGLIHGGDYVIARAFNPELRRTTWKQFLDILPKSLIVEIRLADQEIHVKSQSGKPAVFYFVGLDDPQKLDSMNLSGFAIDEASQVSEEAFLKLQGRLRNPKGLRKGILVGNPKGKNWVYRRFVAKDGLKDQKNRDKYHVVVAPSTENTHLPEGYIENMLASYSPERIQRDIYGSWDSFEGMIYTEFKRDVHVIRPFSIPHDWTRVIGLDHGYTNPAAAIWGAVSPDGDIYLYREFVQSGLLVKEIAQHIVKLSGQETIQAIYVDPSTKATRGQTGSSDFDTYLENIPTRIGLLPAINDVNPGIDRVKSYLKVDARTNKPRLYIFETLTHTIDEITQYQWEELSPTQQGRVNEKEKPKKVNDHAADAVRYLIMSRPEGPRRPADHNSIPWPTAESALQAELKQFRNPKRGGDPFGDM